GVRGEGLKSLRKTSLKLRLKSVVIGSSGISGNDHLRSWDKDRRIQRSAKLRAPYRVFSQQFTSERSYIGCGDGLIQAQRLLDCEVPLIGAGQVDIGIEYIKEISGGRSRRSGV